MSETSVIPAERIASRIYVNRGEKVMLDSDLADLYRGYDKAAERAGKAQSGPISD